MLVSSKALAVESLFLLQELFPVLAVVAPLDDESDAELSMYTRFQRPLPNVVRFAADGIPGAWRTSTTRVVRIPRD